MPPSYLAVTFLKNEKGTFLLSIPLNSSSFFSLILKFISLFRINYLTLRSIFKANLFMTSSQSPLILMKANLSKGVDCKLIMINLPFLLTSLGISAAGVTVRELPIARQTSAFAASSKDLCSSYSGKFYPKLIIES